MSFPQLPDLLAPHEGQAQASGYYAVWFVFARQYAGGGEGRQRCSATRRPMGWRCASDIPFCPISVVSGEVPWRSHSITTKAEQMRSLRA